VELRNAGLEDRFIRQHSDAEKTKVPLGEEQSNHLARITQQFSREMAANGLSMHDLMAFKKEQREAHQSPGEQTLYPGKTFWDANYLGTERALMMGRAELVNQVWIKTLSEAYRRHPDWVGVDRGHDQVIYGRMDIGSWPKLDLGGWISRPTSIASYWRTPW
jgi:hypothetical protein